MSFLERLKGAAQEGILIGVKWAIVLGILGFVVIWAFRDYSIVRARATNGQAAFEFIQKAQAQQQKAVQAPQK